MKNKLLNRFHIFNYFILSDKYKIIFLLTIFLSIYGYALGSGMGSIFDSTLTTFMFYIFNMFAIAIFFLNTLNICSSFNKEFSFYIIRLKNKKAYVKEILNNTFILNIFHFIILLLLYFITLFLIGRGTFGITSYEPYAIPNLIYLIFYIARYIIITIILCFIVSLIFINFKNKAVYIFTIMFLAGFMLIRVFYINIDIGGFYILPWDYFYNNTYNSFSLELSYSVLYILILEIIAYVLYRYTLKNRKWSIT